MDATSDPHPTLWHIAVSHYSEKARWALDYKEVPHKRRAVSVPGLHIPAAMWLTRGASQTYPVLEIDGQRIGDSTEIVAVLEGRFPEPPLYPADPEQRRRALELEDFFDEELGPHLRLLAFHELGKDRERFEAVIERTTPGALTRIGGGGVEPPPAGMESFRGPFKQRAGYQWVEEMFRRHRKPSGALAVTAASQG